VPEGTGSKLPYDQGRNGTYDGKRNPQKEGVAKVGEWVKKEVGTDPLKGGPETSRKQKNLKGKGASIEAGGRYKERGKGGTVGENYQEREQVKSSGGGGSSNRGKSSQGESQTINGRYRRPRRKREKNGKLCED